MDFLLFSVFIRLEYLDYFKTTGTTIRNKKRPSEAFIYIIYKKNSLNKSLTNFF